MDELIGQIAEKTGIDPALARQAIGIILKFLLTDGPQEKVQSLIDAIPDAGDAVASAPGGGGGVMGVFNTLTSAGLGMGDIQGVTQEFLTLAKAKVGDDTVNDIVGSIPGLNQFI